MTDQIRSGYQSADSSWAHVMLGIEHARNRSQVMQPAMHTDPTQLGNMRDDFYLSSRLIQQCCGFKRTLSRANHRPFPSGEFTKFPAFITVRSLRMGEALELVRLASERSDARGN